MRILYLAHRLPFPPNKGDKIRSYWQVKTLAQEHEVDLFCFYDDPDDAQHVAEMRKLCRSVYAERLYTWQAKLRSGLALLRRKPFTLAYFYSRPMAEKVEQTIRGGKYDLIWVFSSSMAQYVESANHLPRVMDMVDVDSDKWLQYSRESSRLRSWLWKTEGDLLRDYENRVASAFSITLFCTPAEAQVFRLQSPGVPIGVLGNCVDMSFWDPSAVTVPQPVAELKPFILFSGQMDYPPNVQAALFFAREVMPRIRTAMPEFKFVIAGRNPTAEIKVLNSDSIVVTGTLNDMRPYLKACAVAVAPLQIARGVQNKVLEAVAMGAKVCASRLIAPSFPDSLREKLSFASTPSEFAEAVLTLVSQPGEIGEARSILSELYSEQSTRLRMKAIVAQVCLGPQAQPVTVAHR